MGHPVVRDDITAVPSVHQFHRLTQSSFSCMQNFVWNKERLRCQLFGFACSVKSPSYLASIEWLTHPQPVSCF